MGPCASSGWRLLAEGVPPRSLRALSAAARPAPSAVLDAGSRTRHDRGAFRSEPGDVFVVWTRESADDTAGRVRALRVRQPSALVLAQLPKSRARRTADLLRAGAVEVFSGTADFADALERARARTPAAPPAPPAAALPAADAGGPGADADIPNVFDWIYVFGIAEDGRITFETVNAPLHADSGFLRPEFASRPAEESLREASASSLLAHLREAIDAGRPVQFEAEHGPAGGRRSYQTILTPVRNKWGRIHRVAGVSRDITALKNAQDALRASEERLAHALEGTQQGLWDWDLAAGHVYRSPRWFEMVGLVPGAVPATWEAGLDLIHPEDRRQVEAAMSAHLEGRLPRFQAEYRMKTRGSEWIWIFDAGKIVAWNAAGRPARMAGTCTDITDRRRAEEALRALVGGVVHEIRNPVYGISINLDALDATFGEQPRTRPFVSALRESAARIQSLMNDLRDYGEPRTLTLEPTLVRTLVDSAVRACGPLESSSGVGVKVDLDDDRLLLPLNARRIHQAFRNLLENALQHAPKGSCVEVLGRAAVIDGHAWWTLTVRDSGRGFDAEALSRAFEPFFTQRENGTGLGLSIVKRVVEEHGGSVEASNRLEGGARVTLRLPVPKPRADRPEAPRG